MSKWSSLSGRQDTFGDDREVASVPTPPRYLVQTTPPIDGPVRPASATDITTITLPRVSEALDTKNKSVLWYEVLVRTMGHQWGVLKRFSEFVKLGEKMEKVGLVRLAKQRLPNSFKPPPSRLLLTHLRQKKLEDFMQSLLQTLKYLSVTVVTGENVSGVNETSGPLQSQLEEVVHSAFSFLICFLTTSSLNGVPAAFSDVSCYPHDAPFCSLNMGDYGMHPPTKVIHIPERRFIIMMQLPGIIVSCLSVLSSEDTQEITVEGVWNSDITSVLSVLTSTEMTQSSALHTGDGAQSSCSRLTEATGSSSVLVDTFPVGSFQMKFEIPPPFAIGDWQSEYVAGVLFLTWWSDAQSPRDYQIDET